MNNKELYKKMDDMETEAANNPNLMRTYKCMWNELKDSLEKNCAGDKK